ncbi:MAG: hypothetical protein AAB967_02580, partial [Patescibacteria group bacterium]
MPKRAAEEEEEISPREKKQPRLKSETKKSIWAIAFLALFIVLSLAGAGSAGPLGQWIFAGLSLLLGWGYFVLPLSSLLVGVVLLARDEERLVGTSSIGAGILVFAVLGLIDIFSPGNGGWLGLVLGSLRLAFGSV